MDSGGGGGGSHKAASGSAPAAAAAAAAAPNPTAMLSALMGKRAKLQEEVRSIERQVYDMETTYLQESNQFGSVLKGFESFLSSSKNTANLKRSRKFQVDERLFSLSSVTSPAVEEQLAARDEAREYAGRSKGASTPANGQGKPKKGGRPGGRDGKRIRPSNDPDLDDEDDY
ncbi:hypothetical protein CFC21_093341 [Triticum aestivum]|nr:chromatin modification-related protein MEAF6 [Aegilops tauschii subsp. strangulata]XP_044420533.1 chromatin modification-related protein MEAF6-like [Triticum aestivum]KAF7090616.1 hypothetical protein CFC21_093341 [Triticum aestivum]